MYFLSILFNPMQYAEDSMLIAETNIFTKKRLKPPSIRKKIAIEHSKGGINTSNKRLPICL